MLTRITLLAAAGLLATTSALAQSPSRPAICAPLEEIESQLAERHGEYPVATGLQSNGILLQVFAARETGKWTMVAIPPEGPACLITAGEAWRDRPPQIAEGPSY